MAISDWWKPALFTREYTQMPNISDPNIGLAAGHAAAGDMYTFPDGLNVRDAIFYHRLAYASAGSTTQFQFFAVNESRGVCNLPGGAQGLPTDFIFLLEGIGFHVDSTQQIDDTAATTSPFASGAATAASVAANTIRILNSGIVNAKVGDMELAKDVRGLRNFPSGSATTAFVSPLATDTFGHVVNGGSDQLSRGFRFTYPKVVYPNKPIRVYVDFPTAVSLGVVGVLECQLFGQLISKGTTI